MIGRNLSAEKDAVTTLPKHYKDLRRGAAHLNTLKILLGMGIEIAQIKSL